MEKEQLERQYEESKGVIERAADFIVGDEFEALGYDEAIIRHKQLSKAFDEFRKAWMVLKPDIGNIDRAEEYTKYIREVPDVEDTYYRTYGILKRKIRLTRPKKVKETQQNMDARKIIVNMPFQQHDLKKTWGDFDGTMTKWQGFRDLFTAAVHNNDAISPAYKFSYLKSSLTGRAQRTLGEWQLTDENYKEAWQRLNQLYDKKYLTCRDHLRALFRLPVIVGQPRANDLQRMSNVTHETLRQLKALGVPVDDWNMIIVHMLHERLDSETARQWELSRTSEMPTTEEMTSFLDKQADSLVNVSDNRRRDVVVSVQNERAGKNVRDQQAGASANVSTVRKEVRSNQSGKKMPCEVCARDHPVWQCPDFQGLTFRSRKDFVERRALCVNCLKRGHGPDNCFMSGCYRCPGAPKHNQMLCPVRENNKPALTITATDRNMDLAPRAQKRKSKSGKDKTD